MKRLIFHIILIAIPLAVSFPAAQSTEKFTFLSTSKHKTVKSIGGIQFIYIQAGEFFMGSKEDNGYFSERPQHKVKVNSFWIGKFEITQKQYMDITGKNPSFFKGANNPVEQVSYSDAMEFCRKFSQKYGLEIRLPTEAEWEYACRSGSTTEYYWGNAFNEKFCWFNTNSGDTTWPVGKKKPNAWGIFDMIGNVYEWCIDTYTDDFYKYCSEQSINNPINVTKGESRVIRGGAWCTNDYDLRSAFRAPFNQSKNNFYTGFRVIIPVH